MRCGKKEGVRKNGMERKSKKRAIRKGKKWRNREQKRKGRRGKERERGRGKGFGTLRSSRKLSNFGLLASVVSSTISLPRPEELSNFTFDLIRKALVSTEGDPYDTEGLRKG